MSKAEFSTDQMGNFARIYSKRALNNCNAAPEGMSELTKTNIWREASEQQRTIIVRDIKRIARSLFINAGYSLEIVNKNIPNN